jgi:uncharacterized protein
LQTFLPSGASFDIILFFVGEPRMRCPQCGGEVSEGAAFCDHCGAKVDAQKKQDPLLGRTLLNQYIIRSKLGEGGFGAVYEADQPSMRRRVAIKTLHRHLIHNPQIVARFHREGMAASQLEHPYAVKMFNSGETDDGILWLAMEFLSGKTLEERIKEGGPLPPQEFVAIMSPVCEMLGEAHSKGIVHRDLKPDNIMLVPAPSGQIIPKVLDFGIAGLLESEGSATKSGVISGTPKYMSPEQWEGLKNTDARSDIYSLGIISYQCLSGQLPFHADSVPQWMQKHCFEEPPSLKDLTHNHSIPTALVQAIMKSLQKKPAARFQTMLEMRDAFQQSLTAKEPAPTLMHSMPPVMKAPAPLPPVLAAPKAPSRLTSSSISIAVIAASLLISGVVWFLQRQPDTKPPETNNKPLAVLTSTSAPVEPAADAPAKCEKGDFAACVALGAQYAEGSGGASKDGLQALSFYRKACDGGFAEGCFKLGQLFYRGSGGVNADKAKAAEFYKKSCDAKHYEGCNELGLQYKYADGVPKDLVLAAELLLKACDAQLWGSCNDLGTMYEKSEGITNDLTKAAFFYAKACDHQFGMSCSNLGWVVKKEPNYPKALALFTKACDLKYGGGCDGLGLMYQEGAGVPQDDKIAKSFYEKGCDTGSMVACVDLGFFWNKGRGGAQDYAQALANYKKACDGDYNLGCYNLGFMYGQGQGVAQDHSLAFGLYTKACNASYSLACSEIGYYYEKGFDVPANASTAATFYQKGCDLGDNLGCSNLGLLYQKGVGVPKDLNYAFDLFDKGCTKGDAVNCSNLAWMYYNGKAVKKDKARGKSLYKYACDKGDTFSCDVLKDLK